jgi:23S rRNA pseudouridine1911/1915/1917 synthase
VHSNLSKERLEVQPEDAGERVDRFLASRMSGLSRSRIKTLIKSGLVSDMRGTIENPDAMVKPGDVLTIEVPPPEPARPVAQDLQLTVVYEDSHLIVIDKPAGLVVHPAAGHISGTLVNALLAHCGDSLSGIGGVKRPGIVHRLDKDTSGLLVVAKTDAAHLGLAEQFASHGADGRLQRAYLGLAWGAFDRPRGIIDAPLGRSRTNRKKMAVVRAEGGRRAVTHYEVLETIAGADNGPAVGVMRIGLQTGRTHQIRVHMAHIGHPLLGDATYGAGFAASARRLNDQAQAALKSLGRQALHAAVLGFEHPITGRRLRFESAWPGSLRDLLEALGSRLAAVET